jgi:two-component system LytT family sensor kinase
VEPRILSPDQFLLTTLVFKLALMALLATMLVRFRRFRHILIFERRHFQDRLVLSLALGVPLTFGVAARILLRYYAADLTLEGAFLVGLVAGPYSGAIVGGLTSVPALIAGEWGALPFAVGCGFAGGGLRELCPKEAIWHFSPFVFSALPRRIWHMARRLQVDWQIILVLAPIALELLRQAIGLRFGPNRLFYLSAPSATSFVLVLIGDRPLRRHADQDLEQRPDRASPPGTGEAAPRSEDLGARLANQPAFPLQHPDLDLFPHPVAAGNRAHGRAPPVGAPAPPAARSESLRHAARRDRGRAGLPRHRDDPLRAAAAGAHGDRRGTLDVQVPSMILQPLVENCIKHGLSRKVGGGTITICTRPSDEGAVVQVSTTGSACRRSGWTRPSPTASASATSTNGCA